MVVPVKCHIFARWLMSGGFDIECPGKGDGSACAYHGKQPATSSSMLPTAPHLFRPLAMRPIRPTRPYQPLVSSQTISGCILGPAGVAGNFAAQSLASDSELICPLPPKLARFPHAHARARGSARGPILQLEPKPRRTCCKGCNVREVSEHVQTHSWPNKRALSASGFGSLPALQLSRRISEICFGDVGAMSPTSGSAFFNSAGGCDNQSATATFTGALSLKLCVSMSKS